MLERKSVSALFGGEKGEVGWEGRKKREAVARLTKQRRLQESCVVRGPRCSKQRQEKRGKSPLQANWGTVETPSEMVCHGNQLLRDKSTQLQKASHPLCSSWNRR